VDIEQVRVTESSDFVPSRSNRHKSGASTGSSCWPSANRRTNVIQPACRNRSSPRATILIVMGEPSSLRTLETATTAVPQKMTPKLLASWFKPKPAWACSIA